HGCGRTHGVHDSTIGAAAADVTSHSVNDFFFSQLVVVTIEQSDRGKNHSWGAVSALKCLGLKECLLYRMKMFATRKAFDGRDFFSHRCPSRRYATPHRSPPPPNRTGAS